MDLLQTALVSAEKRLSKERLLDALGPLGVEFAQKPWRKRQYLGYEWNPHTREHVRVASYRISCKDNSGHELVATLIDFHSRSEPKHWGLTYTLSSPGQGRDYGTPLHQSKPFEGNFEQAKEWAKTEVERKLMAIKKKLTRELAS